MRHLGQRSLGRMMTLVFAHVMPVASLFWLAAKQIFTAGQTLAVLNLHIGPVVIDG